MKFAPKRCTPKWAMPKRRTSCQNVNRHCTNVGLMSKMMLGQCCIAMLDWQIDDIIPTLGQPMIAIWVIPCLIYTLKIHSSRFFHILYGDKSHW